GAQAMAAEIRETTKDEYEMKTPSQRPALVKAAAALGAVRRSSCTSLTRARGEAITSLQRAPPTAISPLRSTQNRSSCCFHAERPPRRRRISHTRRDLRVHP